MEININSSEYYPCNGDVKNHKNFCMFCWKDTKDIFIHIVKEKHIQNVNKYQYKDITTGTTTMNCPICITMQSKIINEGNNTINSI